MTEIFSVGDKVRLPTTFTEQKIVTITAVMEGFGRLIYQFRTLQEKSFVSELIDAELYVDHFDFHEALRLLKDGKSVKRLNHLHGIILVRGQLLCKNLVGPAQNLRGQDILATDWMEVK